VTCWPGETAKGTIRGAIRRKKGGAWGGAAPSAFPGGVPGGGGTGFPTRRLQGRGIAHGKDNARKEGAGSNAEGGGRHHRCRSSILLARWRGGCWIRKGGPVEGPRAAPWGGGGNRAVVGRGAGKTVHPEELRGGGAGTTGLVQLACYVITKIVSFEPGWFFSGSYL